MAAFIAELVRGSIGAGGHVQGGAATALGLSRGLTLRLVVIPQALRLLVPPLTNQYLHLLKASSLATIIRYPDLINVFTGPALNQTGRAIEIVLMTMAVCAARSPGRFAGTASSRSDEHTSELTSLMPISYAVF